MIRHPEKINKPSNPIKKKPKWIKSRLLNSQEFFLTKKIVNQQKLKTVCQEANCPNITECWSKRHATFLIMGDICTRACAFCDVITGKPKNLDESKLMLEALSGNSHKVITGVTLMNGSNSAVKTFSEVTEVFVQKIPTKKIEYYINNFNTLDKAGSYGIQEWFSIWIKKINGCYYNVMGLPVSKFYKHFVQFEKLMKYPLHKNIY